MLLVEARVHALAGSEGTVAEALSRLASASRTEEGCIEFAAARLVDEGGEFIVLSSWSEEQSMRAHYSGTAYAAYAAAVTPLLARPTDTAVHAVAATSHPVGDPSAEPGRQD